MKRNFKKSISIAAALLMACGSAGMIPALPEKYAGASIQASASGYNVDAALEYALTFCFNYNPKYHNYNGEGGDCCNFVSQCLHAGGLAEDETWYNGSLAWIRCSAQIEYFRNKGYQVIDWADASDIKVGNPVYYYNGNSIEHTAICVGYSENGTPLVAAHNNDHDYFEWTLGGPDWWGGSTRRVTIIMPGGGYQQERIDTEIDNSYNVPQSFTCDSYIHVYDCYGNYQDNHYTEPGDWCTIDAVYTSGYVHLTYPINGVDNSNYFGKLSDFNRWIPIKTDPILPGTLDTRYDLPVTFKAQGHCDLYDCYGNKEYDRYTDPGDTCTIDAVYTNGFVHIYYPASEGMRWTYAKLDDFAYALHYHSDPILPGTVDTRYDLPVTFRAQGRCDMYDRYGNKEYDRYTDPGDTCTIDAVYTNGFVHIYYPASEGMRWTYAKLTDFAYALPVHSHSYTSNVTKPATCTEDGMRTYTCSCGDSYKEPIKAKGHSYTKETVEPTCVKDGYIKYTCTECGDSHTDIIPAKGHDYKKTVVEATDTKDGVITYTCRVCQNTYTEKLPATGSKYPIVSYEVSGRQFRLKWNAVTGAEKYGIAVYQSGKWKLMVQTAATSYTSPKISRGTYKIAVCAKIGNKWDTTNIKNRAFALTIQ